MRKFSNIVIYLKKRWLLSAIKSSLSPPDHHHTTTVVSLLHRPEPTQLTQHHTLISLPLRLSSLLSHSSPSLLSPTSFSRISLSNSYHHPHQQPLSFSLSSYLPPSLNSPQSSFPLSSPCIRGCVCGWWACVRMPDVWVCIAGCRVCIVVELLCWTWVFSCIMYYSLPMFLLTEFVSIVVMLGSYGVFTIYVRV